MSGEDIDSDGIDGDGIDGDGIDGDFDVFDDDSRNGGADIGADIGDDGIIEGWLSTPVVSSDPDEPDLPIMPPQPVRLARSLTFGALRASRRNRDVRLVVRMDCTEAAAVDGNGALHFTEFTKHLASMYADSVICSRQYDRNNSDDGGPFDPNVRLVIDMHCTTEEIYGGADSMFYEFQRFLRRDYPAADILCRRYDRKRVR